MRTRFSVRTSNRGQFINGEDIEIPEVEQIRRRMGVKQGTKRVKQTIEIEMLLQLSTINLNCLAPPVAL